MAKHLHFSPGELYEMEYEDVKFWLNNLEDLAKLEKKAAKA